MSRQNMDKKFRRERDQLGLCSFCGLQYQFFFKDPTKAVGPRCPMILKCGHSICFGCIRNKSQRNTVKCPECLTVSEYDDCKDIRDVIPVNIFAVGQIFTTKIVGKPKDAIIGFSSSKKKLALQNSVLCVECGETPSDCECRQCNAQLCSPCFDKIHSVGIILKKHEKSPIDNTNKIVMDEEAMCNEHPENICEYYCENCSKYICDTCLRKEHLKHSCVPVSDKNKEIFQEFTEALDEANGVLKELYSTKKKLKKTETHSIEKEANNVEREVSKHFSYLHAFLQLLEEDVTKEIRTAQGETRNAITSVMTDVDNNIKEMEVLVGQGKAVLGENALSFPLHGLLEKLKNISATPCYLIQNYDIETTKIEFSIDPSITKQLRDHSTIILPKKKVYDLVSKFELPDDVKIDCIGLPSGAPKNQDEETDLFESVEKVLAQTVSGSYPTLAPPEVKTKKSSYYQDVLRRNRLSLQNKSVDTTSVTSSESDIESICDISPLTTGTTETVFLCHLVSPNSFYVQRKQAQTRLQKMSEHFSKQANIKRQPPDSIEPDKMYLVLFNKDKKWYRGTVVKKNETSTYEVFYVDYGNTETVHSSKFREIPEHYANIPGQAIHCCLHSCASVQDTWSNEALKFIASMCYGVDFSMYIENIKSTPGQPDTYEVHLKSVDDKILSVADVLIYLGYAQLAEKTSMDTEEEMYKGLFSHAIKHIKTYFTDVFISKGETFDAQITHINTPTNFYVQKINDGGKQLIELMKDLKQHYSSLGSQDELVFSPVIGLPVAAKFKDGEWYRGVVLQVAKACYVQIQYVDFGNIECVHWTDIRTLHSKFLRKNIQGIKCALSDITPKHQKGWSVPAKRAFDNMAKKKTLFRAFVEKVEPNQISVVLYETQKNMDICINGLLVKEGHASSVGPSSIRAEYARGKSTEEQDCRSTTSSSVANSQNQKNSYGSTIKLQNLGLDSLFSESKVEQSPILLIDNESCLSVDGFKLDDDATRIKVKVLKAVTPGEIYVTFPDTFKQVMEQATRMTIYYNSTAEEDRDWKDGDLCAVLRLKDNKWHRGIIQSISANIYTVFIKDVVDIVEVDKSGLRTLDDKFKKLMDGSLKCHLSGIVPPSGSKHWPHCAIDYFKIMATDSSAEYFINRMGDVVDGSISVQFLKKSINTGGALEPAIEEWKDLSELLISMGYVLPDVKSKHYLHMKKNHRDANQHDVVAEWLQHSYEIAAQSPFVSDLEKEIASEKAASQSASVARLTIEDSFDNVTKWKPAEPFKKLDFLANPSYVDFQCAIYIQDSSCQSTLDLIQRALSTLFMGSQPKPHDLVWSKDQICIAYYEVDSRWYRGKVLKVNPQHIEVYFVDYGNTEFVQPESLRKQVTLTNIPIQCHRCLMGGMIPVARDGRWPVKALDFIHASIVTQQCRVHLNPPSSQCDFYTVKSLTLPSSLSLIDVLVSMHFATYVIDCDKTTNENNAEEEEEIVIDPPQDYFSLIKNKNKPKSIGYIQNAESVLQDNLSEYSNVTPIVAETQLQPIIDWFDMVDLTKKASQNLAFKDMILPDSLVELSIEVNMVVNSTNLKVNIIECEDPEVTAFICDFQRLQDLIQEVSEMMPPITVPIKGLPCVGCFTEDDSWYRALITDIDLKLNLVSVYYVDYGNDEKIPVSRLREIKSEWLDIPMMCLEVTLYNVCKGPDYDQTSYNNLMMCCLMNPPYTMTIEARQPLQVELYNKTGEIAYQSIIELGLLTKLKD